MLWTHRADAKGTFGSATLRTLAAITLLASASCGSLVELWRLKLALESHFDESAVTVVLSEGGHMLVISEDVARSNLSQPRRVAFADSVARFVLTRYGGRRLTAVGVTFGQREPGPWPRRLRLEPPITLVPEYCANGVVRLRLVPPVDSAGPPAGPVPPRSPGEACPPSITGELNAAHADVSDRVAR